MAAFVRALLILSVFTIAGCVVVPRQTTSFNEDCQIVQRHLKLGVALLTDNPPMNCSKTDECTALLTLYAGLAAGTAVVSGSIVLVGNTVYWLEEQGRCDWPVAEKLKKLPQSLGVPTTLTWPLGTAPEMPVSAESGQ
ncbi:hypothetical protein HGR_02333 [Hylemonella gracilis ATCC 19624]|uniref:Lipoprotein n=1 Tax=Hylemonella gracilis ATCC 19624 TaxID=887062 RepID=F3KPV4_9BURK|nr:hypothetical protein HGR_02333 [Hylemonella gracilis ATCC 19624]